jgi:precorrin-6A/cobalt-precorrin-6A reductase
VIVSLREPAAGRLGDGDVTMARRVLVLGGSTEASELTSRIIDSEPGLEVTMSFAGRTNERMPVPEGCSVRVGGFGGVAGLEDTLRVEGFAAVVDATHPFAAQMPFHAAAACSSVGTPLLRVLRPAWSPEPGDRWIDAPSMIEAAQAVLDSGAQRVLLTIGRQELRAFARCAAQLIVRCIDPPDSDALANATILLARGPFTLDGELEVMRTHGVELVVSKNAGGTATYAKIAAARHFGVPVVMVERPAAPPVATVSTVAAAMTWITERCGAAA